MYDPSTGRFINEDPIRDGLNWYVYCENNPVMFVDPSGEVCWIAIGAIVGAVVSAGIDLGAQAIQNGGFNNIDWASVMISGATGAVSGALATTGVGVVGQALGNATISSIGSMINDLAHDKSVNLVEAGKSGVFGLVAGFAGGNGAAYGLGGSKIVSINKYGVALKQVFSKEYINRVVGRELIKGTIQGIIPNLFLTEANKVKIEDLQNFLGVESDGIIGENTTKAIKSLQKVLGVEDDGIYGPETEKALIQAIRSNN